MKRIEKPVQFSVLMVGLLLALGACVPPPPPPSPVGEAPEVVEPVRPAPPPAAEKPPLLAPVGWEELAGWGEDDLAASFATFIDNCRVMKNRSGWQQVCADAASLDLNDPLAVRLFFEAGFIPYRVRQPDGSETGMITGYYVPELAAARTRSDRYAWPLFGVPEDLLVIDLRSVYPELGDYRLRGRLEGRRVVPYWSRAEIDAGKGSLEDNVLYWVDNPVELFFMQIQGSGRLIFEDGGRVVVHYADQNGHPFRSIGKLLLDRGEMTRDQLSMQNIKAWAAANPERVKGLLAENPSYIFFSTLAGNPANPPGALGVPLTPGRSIAVDPRYIPLGVPVYLSTTWPNSREPLRRLVLAQDTGGAIKGAVRADFYWGAGVEAGALAGRMKQKGEMWVLLPLGVNPPSQTEKPVGKQG